VATWGGAQTKGSGIDSSGEFCRTPLLEAAAHPHHLPEGGRARVGNLGGFWVGLNKRKGLEGPAKKGKIGRGGGGGDVFGGGEGKSGGMGRA